ncbi:MAG: NAD(P)H-hydrate dehydratase [Chloroflexi bacterium]|nr:NAD(P)H-hydrate dehydratase [Chloroflexota bacterium]
MRIVSAAEMRLLEKLTDECGCSYECMMELAGKAVAQVVVERIPAEKGRIVILIGPGNNGGDGLVAARYLRLQGYIVACYALKHRVDADTNRNKLAELQVPFTAAEDDPNLDGLAHQLEGCAAIVDALFGTGMQGPLRGNAPAVLARVRHYVDSVGMNTLPIVTSLTQAAKRTKPLVIAVDMPSGLDADTGTADANTLKADITVTFGCPKYGHFIFPGAALVGQLHVADIGLVQPGDEPAKPHTATPQLINTWLPQRPSDSNKGMFGSVLVVGGSSSYSGAPRLAAEAAYRLGAGLVTLGLPVGIYPSAAAQLPDTTFLVFPDNPNAITAQAVELVYDVVRKYSALLIGPGLGAAPETKSFMDELLGLTDEQASHEARKILPPTVIDADGLNLLSAYPRWWERLPAECAITPHPGEMARLCNCSVQQVQADRWGCARKHAVLWRCTVVLKGAFTVCASPQGEVIIIPFANPLLAVAGTGDVLAGAIAGLVAQKMPIYQAAVCGAFLHGLAGEYRRAEIGEAGLMAHELLPLLARAANDIRQI